MYILFKETESATTMIGSNLHFLLVGNMIINYVSQNG